MMRYVYICSGIILVILTFGHKNMLNFRLNKLHIFHTQSALESVKGIQPLINLYQTNRTFKETKPLIGRGKLPLVSVGFLK